MTLIEGIGDEVTQFFIALLVVLVVSVSFAWWTTSISEQRHVQTVWLLDRRRHRAHRRLTNHTHAVTITEGTTTAALQADSPTLAAAASAKPPEAGTSSSDTTERGDEDERTRIVQAMDDDACVLRQRRLAFYERSGDSGTENSDTSDSNPVVMEHNYAEAASSAESREAASDASKAAKEETDIRIKLKYINDDLKLVDGKLKEQLGDFKKRHFQPELSSNKLVRLIFNGQVLQQDSKTLEGCGLFDNCVVHCLIHQRRSTPGEENSPDSRNEQQSQSNHNRNTNQNNNNNNNQGRDWDFGNFLFAIISFTLLSAWYFRYVYAHLYTVTATVGLILMTGVFTIVLFGFYFPDHEPLPPTAPPTQT
ncbi:transmembrane and ubiquitin-like domain-containing protein 1 isoform X3 [Zophobas morio]|uniref:transmembrane and ubiquitin-like domain-containing protein 1 isoform X3 n=1 Tax=Zophobas morio TaxID=2755281 RepID=UPI00308321C3